MERRYRSGDNLSGPTASVSKSYANPGAKTGSVTVTSGGNSQTFACGTANVCAAGSAWDGSSCVVGAYSCTNLPAHASPYPDPDNTGLTADTVYARSDTDTAAKCEFKCQSGYGWNGSACAALPDLTASLDPASSSAAAAILAVSGTAFNFTATISNMNAPTPTGLSFTNLYQMATDANGTNVTDIGTFITPALSNASALPIGGTKTNLFDFTLPFLSTSGSATLRSKNTASAALAFTPPTPGTYYLRVCADKGTAGGC